MTDAKAPTVEEIVASLKPADQLILAGLFGYSPEYAYHKLSNESGFAIRHILRGVGCIQRLAGAPTHLSSLGMRVVERCYYLLEKSEKSGDIRR